ncbi:MAG TPA: group II truncated hemoglobin [Acidimicrobiales bacterium]|nr:group II truncated hemoglobin [Acidimicrobiales bacterium]HLN42051.1 group II truncated hemoglobin [Acidimicrobiales bacterium]
MTPSAHEKVVLVSRPSIFEFAGGSPAFLALAVAHHERCLQDPVLNHPFSHPGHPRHVERLAAYWAEVFGGPRTFSQSCGGHSGMLNIHAGQGAEQDLGERFVECFVQAADDAGLPDDPDFRGSLRAYMEWAVRDVLAYSPQGTTVPEDLAVPGWSWDGLEPHPARREVTPPPSQDHR